jgi:hypothetical protein
MAQPGERLEPPMTISDLMRALARGLLSSIVMGAAITALLICVGCGILVLPAGAPIAERCTTVLAIVVYARLIAWVAIEGGNFHREQRLATFVTVVAVAMSWYGARQWIHARQFDALVQEQKVQLELAAIELSGDIFTFMQARARIAPPRPKVETWAEDEDAILRFDQDTATQFETNFGPRLRLAHDVFALRGIVDKDFETFYSRPANAFQVSVIAEKLRTLAAQVERR